jgi:hypothetical protein
MTIMRPSKTGIDPITRLPATIKPQSAIGPGFAATARIDVHTALSSPTSRSSNSGNDTTLIANHHQGEEETNAHSHHDHNPPSLCGEDVAGECGDRNRRRGWRLKALEQIASQ